MTNQIIDSLLNRRSIRKFKPEQLREEDLQAILKVGTYAPSGAGKQSAVIVAVTDPTLISKLSKMNGEVAQKENDQFYGAPCVCVVLANKNNPNAVQDASCVMMNLMNAAHAIGVGSCWINRAKQMFESEEGIQLLKDWGLEDVVGVANCILGYPDQEVVAKPRKENYIIRIK